METSVKKKIQIGTVIFIIAVLLFFFIRILYCQCWFSSITFSKEVVPLDVINIFVSGAIAIWLGYYITKKLTEQRFLKEFIIKDIYRIEEQIESFEKMTHANKIELQTIFNELHDLKHKLERFERTTNIANISCKEVKELNKCHTELYKITTIENIFEPQSKRNEIGKICDDFVSSLRKIVCDINNA